MLNSPSYSPSKLIGPKNQSKKKLSPNSLRVQVKKQNKQAWQETTQHDQKQQDDYNSQVQKDFNSTQKMLLNQKDNSEVWVSDKLLI